MYETIVTKRRTMRPINALAKVVDFIVSIIEIILLLRFAFILMELNPASSIVHFIYSITNPLVKPVQGLIAPTYWGKMTIDWTILIAMLGYWIIAQILIYILSLGGSTENEIPVHVDEVVVQKRVS